MLSREELDEIRAEVDDPSGSQMYASDALETIHVLLWHIDALEAREKPVQKLPEGARTLPDGAIRLGVPRRHARAQKAAQDAYDRVKAKREQENQ